MLELFLIALAWLYLREKWHTYQAEDTADNLSQQLIAVRLQAYSGKGR